MGDPPSALGYLNYNPSNNAPEQQLQKLGIRSNGGPTLTSSPSPDSSPQASSDPDYSADSIVSSDSSGDTLSGTDA